MTDHTGQAVMDFPARARTNHPIQSHLAAERKNESKTLSADRMAVLVDVYNSPGKTAKQLDLLLCGKAHRRALELENLGLITRIKLVTKNKPKLEMTMYITEKGKELLSNYQN